MGRLQDLKEKYDQIVIPEELHVRVEQEIMKSRTRQEEENRANSKKRFKKALLMMKVTAAAAAILFTTALNTSPIFAKEAAQLPVIGGLAQVLTFRSYQAEKDDIAVSVEIPSIQMIADDTGITTDAINQDIYDCCKQYADQAVSAAEEYRTAFLATGGTPEEWAEHKIRISVNYEIKQQNQDYLSFVVRGTQNWANGNNEAKYYNLDVNTGKYVTLKDMLGDNYSKIVNQSIEKQITERKKAGEVFFTPEEGGFAGISGDTKFYINGNNRPVIVFEPYEIAPGSSGKIEFEVGGENG